MRPETQLSFAILLIAWPQEHHLVLGEALQSFNLRNTVAFEPNGLGVLVAADILDFAEAFLVADKAHH